MVTYSCILFYSLLAGIDPTMTDTVIKIESNNNPFAIGQEKDYGLMQVRAKYAPESKLQLLQACTNIRRGVALLKQAKDKCSHGLHDKWITCYNLGIAGGLKLRHPEQHSYWLKYVRNK